MNAKGMNAKGLIVGFVAAMVAMLAVLMVPTLSPPMLAAAQAGVTSADIQRLQDEVYQASTDVSRLRTSDALQAGRLQDDLDNLREEVIYLKVKLRKENNVSRAEYHAGAGPAAGPARPRSRRRAWHRGPGFAAGRSDRYDHWRLYRLVAGPGLRRSSAR